MKMRGEMGEKKASGVLLYRSVAAVDLCNDPYGVSSVQGDSENKVFLAKSLELRRRDREKWSHKIRFVFC